MINVGKKTDLSSEEIIKKSIRYFGPSGVGLKLTEKSDCCARFDGSGGFVSVQVTETEGEESDLSILGREFDYQIKNFLKEIT